jgi:acetate kinase
MYLLLRAEQHVIRYAAFSEDCQPIYEGVCEITDWSNRTVAKQFHNVILGKLRAHGKIFARVGIIIPFAPHEYVEPRLVDRSLVKQLASTTLQRYAFEPSRVLLEHSTTAWPHLPHYFIFDTCLSASLTRSVMLPPFSFDSVKQFSIQPMLLESYGHKANIMSHKSEAPMISLIVDQTTSIALFEDGKLLDASVSYSPLSSLMGPHSSGSLDPGMFLDLAERMKLRDLSEFFTHLSGIDAMTETHHSMNKLLAIAGLGTKKHDHELPIETVEWIHLAMKSFIRSIRHAVADMAAHEHYPKVLLVNAPDLDSKSPLLKLIAGGALDHLRVTKSDVSSITAACHDLASVG